MSGPLQALTGALGWTLLHFLWQGLLLGGATALLLLALRGARAEHRYLAACTGLLACLVWPALTLMARLQAHAAQAAEWEFPARAAAPLTSAHGWLAVLQDNLAAVVFLWAVCATVLALRMALGLLWVGRLARRFDRDAHWQDQLTRMAARAGIGRPVRLHVVSDLASPITAGWLRPVVLVPAALLTGLPPELLAALLAHELAHVRRFDYLVNLGQNVVETLLFYHPAVWWISGRIRIERECIADDIAVTILGERRPLALALSELEKLQFSRHHLALAAAGGQLSGRIRRLIRPDAQALNWKAALPIFALLALCLGMLAQAGEARLVAQRRAPVADFSSCPKPVYPAQALQNGDTGTVTLSFLVSQQGRVDQAHVFSTSGHATLDEAARDAIRRCSFRPGSADGQPVAAWVKLQYVWTLE